MTELVMGEREAEIQARADAATPGPWAWNPSGYLENEPRMFLEARGRDYGHVLKITWPELLRRDNAEFIAHARSDVPYLLARVATLEADTHEIAETALEIEVELRERVATLTDALRELLEDAESDDLLLHHERGVGEYEPASHILRARAALGEGETP